MPFAYGHIFKDNIAKLKREGRYRIFADILGHRGEFPAADHHTANGVRGITVWCSNDYLCMGQHPAVTSAMKLAMGHHPVIGGMPIFGQVVWIGWLAFGALLYSSVPAFFLGRAKKKLGQRLHDKVLMADAQINAADWQSAGAAMLGMIGLAQFLPGIGVARFTARPAWLGALRQLALGAAAAGITYGVGSAFGVGLS